MTPQGHFGRVCKGADPDCIDRNTPGTPYAARSSVAKGRNTSQIPPFGSRVVLRLAGRHLPVLLDYFLEPEIAVFGGQDRPAPEEDETGAYVVVGVAAGLTFDGFLAFRLVHLDVKLENLLDTPYQSHLSGTPGIGRNLKIGLRMEF